MERLKYVLLSLLLVSPVAAEVSFTFDDGYTTQIDHAFPVLEEYNLKGTVYLITGKVGQEEGYMNWGDVDFLAKQGWTIGAHTVTHPDFSKLSLGEVRKELVDSAKALAYHDLPAHHFAAPYGEFSNEQLRLIRKYYRSNRMAWFTNKTGLNYGRYLNRSRIQAVPLNEDTDLDTIKYLIRRAARENVWLVLMIHRVRLDRSTDPWQISQDKLKEVVEYTVKQKAHVVTVDQYLRYRK